MPGAGGHQLFPHLLQPAPTSSSDEDGETGAPPLPPRNKESDLRIKRAVSRDVLTAEPRSSGSYTPPRRGSVRLFSSHIFRRRQSWEDYVVTFISNRGPE